MKKIIILFILSRFSRIFALPALTNFVESEESKIWAVLVAGLGGWINYDFQGNICHAYQILHAHGVPDERIIVMMVNDIAYNPSNPDQGVVINRPGGPNVYEGVPHDYTGNAVAPEPLIAILKGDEETAKKYGSGKVLKSGPNDHVFLFFSDHGGHSCFVLEKGVLTAQQLNSTIDYMWQKKMYGKMVIYLEACFSGSMFSDMLPKDINVFATTSSKPDEESFTCYYVPRLETCVGDLFSVSWMEDSDKERLYEETLKTQYEIVKHRTNLSHVMKYGDFEMESMHLSEFQGRKHVNDPLPVVEEGSLPEKDDTVSFADKHIYLLRRAVDEASSEAEKESRQRLLAEALKNREFMYDKVKEIAAEAITGNIQLPDIMDKHSALRDFNCYDEARDYFDKKCFKLTQNIYALKLLHVLVNLCEHGISPTAQKQAMDSVCTHAPMHGIH